MTQSKMSQRALNEIDDLIDRTYDPKRMTVPEAIEFLEQLRENVRSKLEALREENDL